MEILALNLTKISAADFSIATLTAKENEMKGRVVRPACSKQLCADRIGLGEAQQSPPKCAICDVKGLSMIIKNCTQ